MISAIFPLFLMPFMLLLYIGVPVILILLINRWMNRSFYLRQEQNELLRELIRKIKD